MIDPNFVKIGEEYFPSEWFDFDRSEKMSVSPMDAAIERAKAAGFVVETYPVMAGLLGYQLKSPDGEYVQFSGSEEGVWRHAYNNGLLPAAENAAEE